MHRMALGKIGQLARALADRKLGQPRECPGSTGFRDRRACFRRVAVARRPESLADKTNALALRRQAVVALAGLKPDRPGLPLTNLNLAFPAAVEVLMETTSEPEALDARPM